jgi:hypothetical protein
MITYLNERCPQVKYGLSLLPEVHDVFGDEIPDE